MVMQHFKNSPPTYKTLISIAFLNLTQRALGNLAFHSPSPIAQGCTNSVDGSDGGLATQSHSQHKKTMRKNGNWDNASLKLAMENVETNHNL